ncbi:hypothetical protein ABK040_006935 [Willaertia magna]
MEKQRQYYIHFVEARTQTDSEILQSYPFFVRPFMKAYMEDVRSILTEKYHPLEIKKQIEMEMMTNKNKKTFYNVSSLTKSKVAIAATSTSGTRPLLVKLFGFFTQESLINRGCDYIWSMLLEHIANIKKSGVYNSVHLENVNWTGTDFYLWTIHLWVLYRRLRFEGSDGDMLSKKLCDRYWNYVEHYINENYNVNAYIMPKNLKRLQAIHYGILYAFDEILNLEQGIVINSSDNNDVNNTVVNEESKETSVGEESTDQDALMAEVVWRTLYSAGVEYVNIDKDDTIKGEVTVTSEDLVFWVRYIRYLLCWTDHMDSIMLLRGLFHYHLPNDEFVTKWKLSEVAKPRAGDVLTLRHIQSKARTQPTN